MRNAQLQPDGARRSEATRQAWFERAARSTPPAQVADVLVEAIREERFYVYTDHEWDERIRSFCDDIVNGANPVVGGTA